jgi:hypothetical protein
MRWSLPWGPPLRKYFVWQLAGKCRREEQGQKHLLFLIPEIPSLHTIFEEKSNRKGEKGVYDKEGRWRFLLSD